MPKPLPTISIALATYNGSKFIEAQLQSLADQDHLPIEIVITDDGSTDDTLDRIATFARTAPFPIHIHRNDDKLGYRKNFLKAAALCTAEIVAFCDQDDHWRPNKLNRVAEAFRDPEVFLVSHNAAVVDATGNFIRPLNPEKAFPASIDAMDGSPWEFPFGFTTSFRSSLMAFLPLHETSLDPYHAGELLGHDQWVTLLASALGRKVYIEDFLVDYRLHGANTFGVSTEGGQSLFERLHLKIEDRSDVFGRLKRAARVNTTILARVAASKGIAKIDARRATQAAERWQSLSELYELRTRAYTVGSIFERFGAVSRLAALNGYNDTGVWSFGRKSQARDLLLGVLAGPLITQLGAKKSDRDAGLRALSPLPSSEPGLTPANQR